MIPTRSRDRITPISTATWIGTSRVAVIVISAAAPEDLLVCQVRASSRGLSELNPARINSPARAGMGTSESSGPRATTNSSIHRPLRITAQRVRPPAITLNAVCPTLPPTGMPPTTPDARLAPPWAKKSRLTSTAVPSALG